MKEKKELISKKEIQEKISKCLCEIFRKETSQELVEMIQDLLNGDKKQKEKGSSIKFFMKTVTEMLNDKKITINSVKFATAGDLVKYRMTREKPANRGKMGMIEYSIKNDSKQAGLFFWLGRGGVFWINNSNPQAINLGENLYPSLSSGRYVLEE